MGRSLSRGEFRPACIWRMGPHLPTRLCWINSLGRVSAREGLCPISQNVEHNLLMWTSCPCEIHSKICSVIAGTTTRLLDRRCRCVVRQLQVSALLKTLIAGTDKAYLQACRSISGSRRLCCAQARAGFTRCTPNNTVCHIEGGACIVERFTRNGSDEEIVLPCYSNT